MRTPFPKLTLALALAGGLPAQLLTLGNSPTNTSGDQRGWYATVSVTNPQGITIHEIDLRSQLTGTIDCSLYLRQGAALPEHRFSTSGWTLHDTATSTNGTGTVKVFAYDALYLAPGTYGIALIRSGGFQFYADSLQTTSNGDLAMTGVGCTQGSFSGAGLARTFVGTIHYSIGPIRTVTGAATADGSQSLVNLSATADLNGQTGGLGGFVNHYINGASVTVSAPASTTVGSGTVWLHHWAIDGVAGALGEQTQTFVADASRNAEAIFESPRTVTVAATVDGVPAMPTIAASPSDLLGNAVVTAPGSFAFLRTEPFELTAPPDIDGRGVFERWTINGVPQPDYETSIALALNSNVTAIAEYARASCFDADLGTALGMGDDTLSNGHALGFDFPLPGGGVTNTIDICSNGFVWLQSGTSTSASPTPGDIPLRNGPPRLCPLWTDLKFPTSASDVFFRTQSDRAVITWRRVGLAGSSDLFTVQCMMYRSGRVQVAYTGHVPTTGVSIVGMTEGNGAAYPPDTDLSGVWTSGTSATWFEVFIFTDFDLDGVVFTATPNGTDGYRGTTLQAECAAASVQAYGTGCPTTASFYQLGNGANLAGNSFALTPNSAGGYDVSACAGSCYDSSLGTAITIGDDELYTVNLPFAFAYPSNEAGTTAISLCSNGFVWLDAAATTQAPNTPFPSQFFNEPARLAPYFCDLDPSDPLSDAVYVKALANRVVLTWHDVVEFGRFVPHTIQCVLFADGTVTWSYGGGSAVFANVLTGFTPGYGTAAVGPIDLVASVPFATSTSGFEPLLLDALTGWTPVLGEGLPLEVRNVPTTPAIALTMVGFGQQAIDLGFLGASGCSLLNTFDVSFPVVLPSAIATIDVDIPANPQLIGAQLFVQSAVLSEGINALGIVTSNGLALTLGEF
ncbi:MAG TPA: hypothetical protein VFZ65_10565 [Planctomycetota bacterium]|nr:hypothetical protein [Planctomycetota bacterium]